MNVLIEGNTNFHAAATCWTSTINRSSIDSKSSAVPDTSWSATTNPRNSIGITVLPAACGANVCHESTSAAESHTAKFHNE